MRKALILSVTRTKLQSDLIGHCMLQATSSAEKKKYGIDAKNTTYRPGGGNVKIFEQKMDVKKVGSRIDAKVSPRKSDASPRVRK